MMTRLFATFTLIAAASVAFAATDAKAPAEGTGIGDRVPAFTAPAIDLSGTQPKTADFDSHKTTRATAYVFVGCTCPATNAYAERLTQLEHTYAPKGVDFLFLYPNKNDTTEEKLAFHKQKQFTGRLIDDEGGKLAHLFKATRTSELFLTDKKGIVVYHGAIDDSRDPAQVKQRYLANALDEMIAGKPVTTSMSEVFA